MGEFSEMVLEGILCEWCGVFIEGTPPGYPQRCDVCKKYKSDTENRGLHDVESKT